MKFNKQEVTSKQRQKKLDGDMSDLVEYVKWVTSDLTQLRDRVKIAENVISALKTTGDETVESMLSTLAEMRRIEDNLVQEADNLRDIINTKEDQI